MEIELIPLILAFVAAFLVGFSKTGVVGLGVLIVPIMAGVFGAKPSVGVLLPMLIFADIFAVVYYRRHAQWGLLLRLLPWVLPGIVVGFFTLRAVTSEQLAPMLGILVLALITLNYFKERRGKWLEEHLPKQWWFSALMGFLAGFTTTVGNAAGPIMIIYLLSMGLRKREFMGTGAWYYLIVNTLKIPVFAMVPLPDDPSRGLINASSLMFNLQAAPLIAAGALTGILVFNALPQKWFKRVVLGLALVAALRLTFGGIFDRAPATPPPGDLPAAARRVDE